MNTIKDNLTFTVPLTLEAHQIAQQFYEQHHHNQKKAKQVYLNTLAVYAVKFYLECLEVETDWSASDSWHPALQTLANMADLKVKNKGKLECRPVLPEAKTYQVPPEVWSDRIGYVAVRLDRALTEATLLGFVPAVAQEEIPLNQLQSPVELLEHLSQIEQPLPVKEPIQLSQWLHKLFDAGWEAVESLLEPPQAEFAFSYRSLSQTLTSTLENADTGVKRGKRLDLEREGEQVALCVELKSTASSELNISVEVYPTGEQTYLPQDLQLMVLDEAGVAVMQAQARSTKNIELKFSGSPGERFEVKVALGDVSITEAFAL
jgi:hypothetical protein